MILSEDMTVRTWHVMGSTEIFTELQEIAARKRRWVIVLTETKCMDIRADRQLFKPFLLQYKLHHSC